jgi:predicted RNA-binding protein with PIN domain
MNYLYIDGNNLIGKIASLKKINKEKKNLVREKLIYLIEGYLKNRKYRVTVFFDGHPGPAIKTNIAKIIYSFNKTADDEIKTAISNHRNPKLITLITSDHNLSEFGKVCSCVLKTSEQFVREIQNLYQTDEESDRINNINNDEIKRLFGV